MKKETPNFNPVPLSVLKRGVFRNYAVTTGCARKGPWRMSKVKWVNIALPDSHFESLGLSFPWI